MGKVRWLGHSGFEIELVNKTLLIDPWLTGNPLAAIEVSEIKKADIVCVTHDHGDHLGDAVEICKKNWSDVCWHIRVGRLRGGKRRKRRHWD